MRDNGVNNWASASTSFVVHGLMWGSPSIGSSLSSILEADVPEKFYLSRKAKDGILRRAAARGKSPPPLLKLALEA